MQDEVLFELEQHTEQLIKHFQLLKEENQRLKQAQSAMVIEQAKLRNKNQQAIQKLKNIICQ